MAAGYQHAEMYPPDALLAHQNRHDAIPPDVAKTLPGLFKERIKRRPDQVAYLQHDGSQWRSQTWRQFGDELARWRSAFAAEGLSPGDRVAIRLKNCMQWVLFDQGAMGNGLVVVPVFSEDRADNIAYIIDQTESKVLLVEDFQQWRSIAEESEGLACLKRIVVLSGGVSADSDSRLIALDDWLPEQTSVGEAYIGAPESLATIVFTSGTTGKPKGVMLSHDNILQTAYAGLKSIAVFPSDRMLSFLPLSHMFERTIGCYFNVMAGSSVAFNRSIPELLDDMAEVKPTIIITVPRIFERAYGRIKAQLDEGSALKRWLFEKAVNLGWERFQTRQGNQSGKQHGATVPTRSR